MDRNTQCCLDSCPRNLVDPIIFRKTGSALERDDKSIDSISITNGGS